MTDNSPSTEVSRLLACRACGNRVARTARRCPACGSPDPTADSPAEPRPRLRRPRGAPADRARLLARLVVVVAALAIGVLVVLIVVRVSGRRAPAAEVSPPAVVQTPAAVENPAAVATPAVVLFEPPTPEPSRSRGRRDWPFFFRPGDRLARMGDAKPLGYIVSMVKDHKFGDGTIGPAYLLWTPAGNEEAFDADELERTAKME
jgi:hypothetical protein